MKKKKKGKTVPFLKFQIKNGTITIKTRGFALFQVAHLLGTTNMTIATIPQVHS